MQDAAFDDDGVAAAVAHVHVDVGTHHLRHVDLAGDHRTFGSDGDVLGAHAQDNVLGLHAGVAQALLLCRAGNKGSTLHLNRIGTVCRAGEAGVVVVHLRHSYESRDKEVRRVVKHLLRGTHLLHLAVFHDDDAVAQRHGLGLVMRDVDKRGVDALAQLDDLCAHLVAKLCVQVRERLVHKQNLGLANNGATDGDALALAARERFGLTIQILGYS